MNVFVFCLIELNCCHFCMTAILTLVIFVPYTLNSNILFPHENKNSDQALITIYLCVCVCARAFTSKDLDESDNYDEYQSEEFPYSENILDPGRPAHTGAVHPGQEYCGKTQKYRQLKTLKASWF